MTREDVAALDRENVSVHEAAHALVAQHLGYGAQAAIWPTLAENPVESKLWAGRTWLSEWPDPEHAPLIGLAGEVAVLLRRDPDMGTYDVAEFLDYEAATISETDRATFDGHSREHVDACLELLRKRWPSVQKLAAELRRASE